MAQTSEELRDEIEDTRERMGETMDALAYKADVPTRTKDWLGEKKDAVTSAVSGATPSGGDVKRRANRMKRVATSNPIGLAIGGAAVGFVAGLLTPSTRLEDEKIGHAADEIKSSAADAGREALDRGKEVAQEAGQAAMDTAKERGKEESQELSSSLQEKAQSLSPSEGSSSSPTTTQRQPASTPSSVTSSSERSTTRQRTP
jgi:gas vesicle protein